MMGLVLAAGAGRRLRPHTDSLPKALVPLSADVTPLDLTLRNFAEVGIRDAAIVVGFAAAAVRDRRGALERRHGVRLHLIDNPHAEDRNNSYSLWCAREVLAVGALLANGDTVHPVAVEHALLAARGPALVLALDTGKALGAEEMKVRWTPERGVVRITKAMHPATADGEYIGVALIEPVAAAGLVPALEATWRRDPALYYEDGFQEVIDRGGRVDVAAIGDVAWVEIDDERDLARARTMVIACPS